jgi:hypothetical protein
MKEIEMIPINIIKIIGIMMDEHLDVPYLLWKVQKVIMKIKVLPL